MRRTLRSLANMEVSPLHSQQSSERGQAFQLVSTDARSMLLADHTSLLFTNKPATDLQALEKAVDATIPEVSACCGCQPKYRQPHNKGFICFFAQSLWRKPHLFHVDGRSNISFLVPRQPHVAWQEASKSVKTFLPYLIDS